MAFFVKIDENNIVKNIEVVDNNVATTEEAGIVFLKELHGKQFNYKQFSTKNDFKSISPFIASEEAFDGKTWHTKSLKTGQGGRHAYGYHQIYEDHFVPGAQ